mmetsp:Transcript_1505/g.3193  ORF Transcript_1505/g.3193 Transcript_1505/m.3193 type:complete len:222 (-) Transcript_1505:26-691(-)
MEATKPKDATSASKRGACVGPQLYIADQTDSVRSSRGCGSTRFKTATSGTDARMAVWRGLNSPIFSTPSIEVEGSSSPSVAAAETVSGPAMAGSPMRTKAPASIGLVGMSATVKATFGFDCDSTLATCLLVPRGGAPLNALHGRKFDATAAMAATVASTFTILYVMVGSTLYNTILALALALSEYHSVGAFFVVDASPRKKELPSDHWVAKKCHHFRPSTH